MTTPAVYTTKIPASAWKVLAILGSIATMTMYAETMLVPAFPDLIKDFHVSYSISSWILTTYLITAAVMTPIAGKLSDIYGKKKVLLTIMIIYTIGVSMAGFSTSIYFLLVTRALQGFGMSVFPIVFSIVRDKFPREKISIGNGMISCLIAAGAAIGLMVGGTIIKDYGWQATFFTIIPIAIALLITIWRFIHIDEQLSGRRSLQRVDDSGEISNRLISKNHKGNTKYGSNNIDIKSAITLAITITSFLLVLTSLETGYDSSSANNSSLISASTMQITVFRQYRGCITSVIRSDRETVSRSID